MDSHAQTHRAIGVVLMGLLFGARLYAQKPEDVTGWGELTWNMGLPQVKEQYPQYTIEQGRGPHLVNGQIVENTDDPDTLVIKNFDIDGIKVDVNVHRRPDNPRLAHITLDPNLLKGPMAISGIRESTYDRFKKLLMSKYGAPNEVRTPTEDGDVVIKAVWSFPSTSIELTRHESRYGGYVLLSYEAVRKNPL